jgi:hypothetical protein
MSNDCQIMTLGSRVIAPELAKSLVDVWLRSEFQAGRSGPKVERIKEIEKSLSQCSVNRAAANGREETDNHRWTQIYADKCSSFASSLKAVSLYKL